MDANRRRDPRNPRRNPGFSVSEALAASPSAPAAGTVARRRRGTGTGILARRADAHQKLQRSARRDRRPDRAVGAASKASIVVLRKTVRDHDVRCAARCARRPSGSRSPGQVRSRTSNPAIRRPPRARRENRAKRRRIDAVARALERWIRFSRGGLPCPSGNRRDQPHAADRHVPQHDFGIAVAGKPRSAAPRPLRMAGEAGEKGGARFAPNQRLARGLRRRRRRPAGNSRETSSSSARQLLGRWAIGHTDHLARTTPAWVPPSAGSVPFLEIPLAHGRMWL